jgi:acetoin utilization protein AcuB
VIGEREWTRVEQRMMAPVPAITPRTSVATALRLLREHRAPALPVSDGPRFIGLVDEKALLRLTPSDATTLDVYELREVLDRLTVGRVVERIPAIAPSASLDEAKALMRSEGREVLPVLDGGRLVGLLHWTALL